jgi:S1-C subfamily serine protease
MKAWKQNIIGIVIGFILLSIGIGMVNWTGIGQNIPAVSTKFPNTVQEILPSAVHIKCEKWQGSGVAITEDIIVTARHVIDGTSYEITTNDGRVFEGVQAISHKDYDIGFIKIKPLGLIAHKLGVSSKLKPAKFGSIKDCVLGQPIFIVGSPYGKINFNSVTLGVISGLDRNWEGLNRRGEPYGWKIAFTSDSGAHPGNSGGPVFSMDGVCRGLLVGGFSPVLNCSMPCDLFLNDIENIKLLFAMEKYQSEKKEHNDYPYTVNSREDYYMWD